MTLQNRGYFTVFFGAIKFTSSWLEKFKALPRNLSGLPFKLKGNRLGNRPFKLCALCSPRILDKARHAFAGGFDFVHGGGEAAAQMAFAARTKGASRNAGDFFAFQQPQRKFLRSQ